MVVVGFRVSVGSILGGRYARYLQIRGVKTPTTNKNETKVWDYSGFIGDPSNL